MASICSGNLCHVMQKEGEGLGNCEYYAYRTVKNWIKRVYLIYHYFPSFLSSVSFVVIVIILNNLLKASEQTYGERLVEEVTNV